MTFPTVMTLVMAIAPPPLRPGSVASFTASLSRQQIALPDSLLEECVAAAASEDDVNACMLAYDDAVEAMGDAPDTKPIEDLSELDVCILDARSEDEVQACIEAARFATARAELADNLAECESFAELRECIDGSAWTTRSDTMANEVADVVEEAAAPDPVEACILAATHEDEVKECLDRATDEIAAVSGDKLDALDECILGANSEDGVQACLAEEEERTAAFKALQAKLVKQVMGAASDACIEECVREALPQLG